MIPPTHGSLDRSPAVAPARPRWSAWWRSFGEADGGRKLDGEGRSLVPVNATDARVNRGVFAW